MIEKTTNEIELVGNVPPRWFWVASALGLLWNLTGVAAFAGQMTMDPASLSAAERAFYEATPDWATVAFAIAVSAGLLGCISLLLRRRWAFPVFMVSLLGIVVQSIHSLLIGDGIEVFGPAVIVLPLLTFCIAVALTGFATKSAAAGWLK